MTVKAEDHEQLNQNQNNDLKFNTPSFEKSLKLMHIRNSKNVLSSMNSCLFTICVVISRKRSTKIILEMDWLKAEIAKKRKFLETNSLVNEEKKFFKREELIKKTDEEYWKRQAEKETKKRKANDNGLDNRTDSDSIDSDEFASKARSPEEETKLKLKKLISNQSGSGSSSDKTSSEERVLPRKEVIKRLRERNQPILLFGETEVDAFRRLRKVEILEPDSSDKGLRNDFQVRFVKIATRMLIVLLFQEAMEKVDAAYLEEIVKLGGDNLGKDNEKKKGAHDVKIEEMNTTIDEILQQAQYLGKQRSKRPSSDEEQRKSDCDVILKFLKYLLELWGRRLNERSEVEKRSTQGKISIAIYAQTQNYLKPLTKQLTKGTIADDILKHLILIIKCMLERDYVKASDAYLQMAIGNAPWPIGVTMVGIHARTGREKIFAQNIAHVLNDETQRKYIQALKRLMTQCQKMFPTDPSRCVEYSKEQ